MNYKVSQLQSLKNVDISEDDLLLVVDVNPTSTGGRSKKVTVGDLVDYRILNSSLENFVLLTGSYTNPSFIASLHWSKITDTPTTRDGYGITDVYTQTEVDDLLDTVAGNEVVSMGISGDVTKTLTLTKADTTTVSVDYTDTFIYTQGAASDTWTVTHNMNKYPSVTVVDSAGNIVEGAVEYNDLNSCTITFCGGFSGKAYFN